MDVRICPTPQSLNLMYVTFRFSFVQCMQPRHLGKMPKFSSQPHQIPASAYSQLTSPKPPSPYPGSSTSLIQANAKKNVISLVIPVEVSCSQSIYLSYHTINNDKIGFDALLTMDITKSSAMQRAGRAGREVGLSVYQFRMVLRILSKHEIGLGLLFPAVY